MCMGSCTVVAGITLDLADLDHGVDREKYLRNRGSSKHLVDGIGQHVFGMQRNFAKS